MEGKSIKKNLILSTLYQVLTMLLPLVTAPYAARVLGVDGTGVYSYTHAYVMYFMIFAALGMVSYGTREIARHRDSENERSQIFWEIAILTFVTSLVSILLWGIWIIFNVKYRIYYIILTFFLLGTMFDISWFYAGMEEFKYTVSHNSVFKIMGAVAIFLFVRKAEDLWIYTFILSLSSFISNVSMWIYLPRFVHGVPLRGIRLKHHFHETLVYFIPTIAISVYTILDKTLIGLITHNTSENGNYEQATKIVNMAKSLCFAGVNIVLQSRISYLFAEKRYKEIKQRITVSMDYILFVGIGTCFGLIGIADRFVPVFFGTGYDGTVCLLQLMAPLVVIVGVSNCLGSQYYTPAGLRAKSAKFILIGSGINLAFNLMLIPNYKSKGAVIATIIAESIISVLYLCFCDSYYSFKMLVRQSWKKLIAGLIMLVLVLFIGDNVRNPFLCVLLQIISGVAAYFTLLLLLKDSFIGFVVLPQISNVIKYKAS